MFVNEAPAPIKAVIFDFHATLVDGGDADRWIDAAIYAHALDLLDVPGSETLMAGTAPATMSAE